MFEIIDDSIIDEENHGFVIDSPEKADWAIEKIKERQQRRDIFKEAGTAKKAKVDAQIAEEEAQCESDTQCLKSKLYDYIKNQPLKETKTQKSLKLPSGTIVLKLSAPQMKPVEEKLIDRLKGTEYVSYPPKLAWGEYKKRLKAIGNKVIDTTTGEVVEGVTVEMSQEVIEVK